ncbi:P-loop NTPase family protein [Streptomonospora nanhaiensis]|uniref:hypothetical protein n=1 Tax=Streptomonospora nanhaiensis TaxID=1323731 RepID=UPI001C388AD7|nr:hypothetical protein [Streptomonospora nanhaiensis]MBV2364236.1 hypothetical protein [Streptomonospora nanhaiensis]
MTSLAVASVGSLPEVALSPWWAAGVAAAGGVLHLAEAVRRSTTGFTKLHRCLTWAGAGAWTFTALGSTPWSVELLAPLVAGTAVAVTSAKAAAVYEETVTEREREEQRVLRRVGLAQEWEDRIARVCHIKGVDIVREGALTEWVRPDPAHPGQTRVTGYSIEAVLPAGGKRWTDISSKKLELGADADLPEGCGVEVRRGASARRVVIDVTTVNIFGEDVPLPADYSKRSINQPLVMGVRADGSLAEVSLRWVCGILIGQTGSGKSNALTVLITQLLRCDDVVVVGIDPNGGKAFRPFIRPWLKAGRTGRPAIEWIAPDGGEGSDERAWKLVNWLVKSIDRRAAAYESLMEEVDDDKIPVSHDLPHIVLITDETASLSRRVKAKLAELSNRSRAVSIRQLTCALRAIDAGGNGIPTDLLAQGKVRIAMDVQDDNELAYLFGWSKRTPKAEESKGVGTGFVSEGQEVPRQQKVYRAAPSAAADFAVHTEHLRPQVDQVTIDTDRDAWESRWDWLDEEPSARPAEPLSTPASPPTAASGDAAEALARLGFPGFGKTESAGQQQGAVDYDAEFRRLAEEQLADVGPAPAASRELRAPDLLVRCVEAAGDRPRVHMSTLAEACGVTSRRLGELLRMVGVEPIDHPVTVEGVKAKGYETAELAAAVEQIRRGERECPRPVWDALDPE